MSYLKLLTAHREVNKLLTKLALGMGKEELNRRVVDLSESWFGERRASILRLDSQHNTLHVEHAPSLPEFYNSAVDGVEIGPEVGSCGAAAYSKQSVVVDNIHQHPNWLSFSDLARQANLHACWSVPILSSTQTAMGTFAIYSHEPAKPEEHELEVLQMLASLYAVAWEKYELEHQLHYHARYDSLTGCLNRRALLQQASDCLNTELTYVACFFADIDRFKQINDVYGHEVGDRVLAQVGEIFHHTFNRCSINGRYGGDEFVAFAFSDDKQVFTQLGEQFIEQLATLTPAEDLQVRVSVGKAVSEVRRLISLQQLIKQADQKMYQAKHANRCDQDHGNSAAMR